MQLNTLAEVKRRRVRRPLREMRAGLLCSKATLRGASSCKFCVQAGVLLPSATSELDSTAPAGSPPPAPYMHPSRWAYLRVAQQLRLVCLKLLALLHRIAAWPAGLCISRHKQERTCRDASSTAWRRALTWDFRYDQEAQHRLCTQQQSRHCRSSVRIIRRVQAPQHAPRARPERGHAARRRHDSACPRSVFGHGQQHQTLASSQAGADVSSASAYHTTQNLAPVRPACLAWFVGGMQRDPGCMCDSICFKMNTCKSTRSRFCSPSSRVGGPYCLACWLSMTG